MSCGSSSPSRSSGSLARQSYALAKDYLEQLQAPTKGFYTFEHSAHSPLFEEPEKFGRILLRDVLAGTATLADLPARAKAQATP